MTYDTANKKRFPANTIQQHVNMKYIQNILHPKNVHLYSGNLMLEYSKFNYMLISLFKHAANVSTYTGKLNWKSNKICVIPKSVLVLMYKYYSIIDMLRTSIFMLYAGFVFFF